MSDTSSNIQNTDDQSDSQKPWYDDPLPYVIGWAILFLVFLSLLTWSIGLNYKATQCIGNPMIWCSDNWVCNNKTCSKGNTVSPCFSQIGETGLASCLYGPSAAGATACYAPPANTTDDTSALACNCPHPLTSTLNCFSGCGSNIYNISDIQKSDGGCCGCHDCSSSGGRPPSDDIVCCPDWVPPCPAAT